MKVKDLMTKKVIFVSPEAKIAEVTQLLTEHRIHGVPVVDEGKVVGIIVENDFFAKEPEDLHLPSYINFLKKAKAKKKANFGEKLKLNKLFNIKAKDIMTQDCVTFPPQAEIHQVLRVIKKTGFNTFPVVNKDNKLVGIITLADVLNLLR